MARGLFIVVAMATTTVAMAAWAQPSTKILAAEHGEGRCPLPRVAKTEPTIAPDHDLLLFVYSMAQGMGQRK